MAIFISLLSEPDKAESLLKFAAADGSHAYDANFDRLAAIPGTPFAYWASDRILDVFLRNGAFGDAGRLAQLGASTKNDFRFLRTSWEVLGEKWRLFAKGGNKDPFYTDLPLYIKWSTEPREIEAAVLTKYNYLSNANWILHTENAYGDPGIYQNQRSDRFSPYVLPRGSVFSSNGVHAWVPTDQILSWVALFNSSICAYLIKLMLGRFGWALYTTGALSKLPVPATTDVMYSKLDALGRQGWVLTRKLHQIQETSQAFVLPIRLMTKRFGFELDKTCGEIDNIRSNINDEAFKLYGLTSQDRDTVEQWSNGGAILVEPDDDQEDAFESDRDEGTSSDNGEGVLSWSVGVAFGRFEIRLATGERLIPPEPDPFDPLPVNSPGMLSDGDAPFMPTSGVFVDDPGHPDDLAALVTAVHERVDESPPAPDELRRTLARDFFPVHIRMYSKSRRKAPIYWQLATPSASYSVWLYIHAFGKDTLFRVQNDYVAPKLAHERRALEGLRAEAGPAPTTAQSRAIEAQASFVEELSAMLEEVGRVAPLWDPDLDDGVILNFAPLWRLVPQNRAWQKELRAAWAAMVAGDYDWAHLSMRLWPERVVPKCAKDRSLAIAHDLEDVFWFEDGDGKRQPRVAPTRPLDMLVAERTQASVKAALASLISAPEPAGAARRGRAARAG